MPYELNSPTIATHDALQNLLGQPLERVKNKARSRLDDVDRVWLAGSPLCFVATSDASGRCDVSPKGDPAGLVHVLDDTTIVLPERPGNRRGDSLHNVLDNPHAGLIFLIPGRGDTLRINGRARIAVDEPFFDDLVVKGHRPRLALVVDIEEVYYHCSKAFLRSAAWAPESWDASVAPSRAKIAKTLERPDDSLEVLEEYYGPRYADSIY
ncbi:pyridoxamine 5'-phosphate oxidase family protein [Herbiconiux sp. CPCC 205763]|uniref:Pyridoxamine 5'-phosphate oxidase family protein n=1 Tax=Herbiconiux aconitum TaxID=2970913 RepID=A0ABT2GQ09_9MICO|nr:pyridoxamine 5'-phosphate oxidase family protein [Herbiconiux aconitum]MCS5718304.1 pyridoxamine 5'-phosphate oxidase family protein [Herbiconiux aconitum]